MIRLNRIESGLVESRISSYLLLSYKERTNWWYDRTDADELLLEEIEFVQSYLESSIWDSSQLWHNNALYYLSIIENTDKLMGDDLVDSSETLNKLGPIAEGLNSVLLEEIRKSTKTIDCIYDAADGIKPNSNERMVINDYIRRHYKDLKVNESTPISTYEEVKGSFSRQFENMQKNNIIIIKNHERMLKYYDDNFG